jgi:3-hydroxyisobutyrate dehydrogenase-like beta-hydroxyacid dehydrogenase
VRVAFLGLGRMGAPMAARIATELGAVTAWNRSPAATLALAARLPEVRVASTPAEAAREADVLVTMLADGPALEAALFGTDGAAGTLRPGALVVDMGTSGPEAVRRCAERLTGQGVELVDAPVSGSVPAATDGTLTVMVGGTETAFAQALPVLEAMSRRIIHVGPAGAGAALKVCINAVLFTLNAGLSEALVLAERAGVGREQAYDVLLESVVAAPYLRYKQAAFLSPDTAPVAFSLDLVAKDAALASILAAELGANVPVLRAVADEVDDARSDGRGGQDMSAIASYLRG